MWGCGFLNFKKMIKIICNYRRLPVSVHVTHSDLSFALLSSPAESNCTYFKFFTTGENAVMFQKTTQKSESLRLFQLPTPLFSFFSTCTSH